MGWTNVPVDDELLKRVRRAYGLGTEREAVDFALRRLVTRYTTRRDALDLEGIGWESDLDAMREGRFLDWDLT